MTENNFLWPNSHNNPTNPYASSQTCELNSFPKYKEVSNLNHSDSSQEKKQLVKMNECSTCCAEPNEQTHVNECGFYLSNCLY